MTPVQPTPQDAADWTAAHPMSAALLEMLRELKQEYVNDAIGNARIANHHHAAQAVGGLDAVDTILTWLAGVEPPALESPDPDDFIDPALRRM